MSDNHKHVLAILANSTDDLSNAQKLMNELEQEEWNTSQTIADQKKTIQSQAREISQLESKHAADAVVHRLNQQISRLQQRLNEYVMESGEHKGIITNQDVIIQRQAKGIDDLRLRCHNPEEIVEKDATIAVLKATISDKNQAIAFGKAVIAEKDEEIERNFRLEDALRKERDQWKEQSHFNHDLLCKAEQEIEKLKLNASLGFVVEDLSNQVHRANSKLIMVSREKDKEIEQLKGRRGELETIIRVHEKDNLNLKVERDMWKNQAGVNGEMFEQTKLHLQALKERIKHLT